MGCSNCSSGGGTPKGCKNNGTCSSGGCNKLGVFDWLANMQLPSGQSQFDILEVRFKNGRKGFYRNLKGLPLQVGDAIIVEGSPGHDIGVVSIIGELTRIQIQKKAPNFKPHEARKVYRIATQEDIDKWKEARELESKVMHQARELAINLNLQMKISDVEYQGDLTKATFYYTAEQRVDFRQLIKDMAETFKIRIEMRQIGARQEAARLGGIGSCGRELCCSTWLTDFRSVSTSAARYQQLSLNPQKLAGQCGKLKCCLNYELDMYLDAIKRFPKPDTKLYTEAGSAIHIKTDVFKRLMWFAYDSDSKSAVKGLIPLTPERVEEIIQMNKNKNKPAELKGYEEETIEEPDYTNVVGQDDLNRFEHLFKRKKKKSNRKPNTQGKGNNKPNAETKGLSKAPTKNKRRKPNRPKPEGNATETPKKVGFKKANPTNKKSEGEENRPTGNPNKKRRPNKKRPPRKPNGETKKDDK